MVDVCLSAWRVNANHAGQVFLTLTTRISKFGTATTGRAVAHVPTILFVDTHLYTMANRICQARNVHERRGGGAQVCRTYYVCIIIHCREPVPNAGGFLFKK